VGLRRGKRGRGGKGRKIPPLPSLAPFYSPRAGRFAAALVRC
jgi:hypothetical protein